MKPFQYILAFFIFLNSTIIIGQKIDSPKIIITGKVVEKSTNSALEYATITFKSSKDPKIIFGGISDKKGAFSVEINPGVYDIVIEFIALKSYTLKQKKLTLNYDFGTILLEEDITQLKEVVINNERPTVEIKLDKRVYNVGKDITAKGGTVSDVLDNIPSVSVDVDGSVSLRGNANVKILIDGRPSSAIDITQALRLIPADAIDKVEVITNPSARYDAEGGGGILNIILKKGKNKGTSGNITANIAHPETYGITGTINHKTRVLNVFTTQGYSDRMNPGNAFFNSRYLNADNTTKSFLYENRDYNNNDKSYNGILGIDLYLTPSTTWTNSINYRTSKEKNTNNVFQNYYDKDFIFEYTNKRISDENDSSKDFDFNSNFIHNFKKEGHKLTFDSTISSNNDLSNAVITQTSTDGNIPTSVDNTLNNQDQHKTLVQTDYVLPLENDSKFEAGYRGSFINNKTDYSVIRNGVPLDEFNNILEYKEKVNALYSQFGFKKNKISSLLGLRWEDSNVDVNQLATNDFNNKKYHNFFPSAFVNYEFETGNTMSVSYSRRIQRPRGRQLNPFNSFASNINIYVGNPDLNPSLTDVLELGYLKTWDKITLNTSLYGNKTKNVVQYVRKESGIFSNGIPVIITTPINLATQYRSGFEFTLNYTPYKWWRLNGNFNFYYIETNGEYRYIDYLGREIVQNFDNTATTWFSKITSKVNLPYKIDWQTNLNYTGDQKNAQGNYPGVFYMNLAFSKDILKDKGSINFSVNDVFNSRKRKVQNNIPGVVDTYSEMQWRVRQFNVSFTYRFNKPANDKDKKPRTGPSDGEGGDFQG